MSQVCFRSQKQLLEHLLGSFVTFNLQQRLFRLLHYSRNLTITGWRVTATPQRVLHISVWDHKISLEKKNSTMVM